MSTNDLSTVRQMLAQTLSDVVGCALLTDAVLFREPRITVEQLTEITGRVVEWFAVQDHEWIVEAAMESKLSRDVIEPEPKPHITHLNNLIDTIFAMQPKATDWAGLASMLADEARTELGTAISNAPQADDLTILRRLAREADREDVTTLTGLSDEGMFKELFGDDDLDGGAP